MLHAIAQPPDFSPPPGRERLRASLQGRIPAETPVATWRHHPLHDQHADRLAQAVLADQALFAADLVKLTPASTWQLIDHGLVDAWAGDPIGRRRTLRPVIHDPADWDRLRPLPADRGFRATILAALARTRDQLPAAIPLLATLFDPLFVAIGLAGLERFRAHQREAPQRVVAALRCLHDDALRLIDALAAAGAEGVFLAVQHASPAVFPAPLYEELALDADRALLAALQGRLPFSMLHLHGSAVPIGRFQADAVPFLHYDMGEAGNPPPETIVRPPGCAIATGPSPALFSADDPAGLGRWTAELRRRMAGRPLLMSPGCAVPLAAADAMPLAMVQACRRGGEGDGPADPVARQVLPLDHGGPIHRAFTPFPPPERIPSVLDRFRAVVARHGDRPAILDPQRRWTYRALHDRIEALADVLLRRLGDDSAPVALLLPQDARVPLAQLAVLAAGRLPVPLDPRFPLARNRRILERSGAALILGDGTDPDSADPALTAGRIWLGLDAEGRALPLDSAGAPIPPGESPAPRPLRGDDPAWLLFTSGSTGVPKGVVQNHRGLLHDVMQYTNAIHLRADDRLTQLYSASVSGSLRDIYGALLNGACLHPLPLVDRGVAAVLEVIRHERITVLHAVPGLFRLLVEALAPGETLPHVRLLYLAGDRVDRRDVEAFQAHFPADALLYVGIGSTENATLYAHHFLAADAPLPPGPVPVGRELPDRRLQLVGEDGDPVPAGAVGEVECTSRYLAQGYWRDPEATARSFRPCGHDPTVRRFRSGDRARLGADGLLRFVGRRDDQLKISGRRLEPAEVEAALLALPAVTRALVMALPDAAGEPSLVAWLQGREGHDRPTAADLRRRLRAQLPEGLVPTRFEWLDRWPLTANGKVDRQALARLPLAATPAAATAPTPPATERQQQLHRIWSDVLGHGDFGLRDDFFLVGGHSLAAVRVLTRIEQRWGCSLPLSAIVENATIEALAAQLDVSATPLNGSAPSAHGAIPVAAPVPLPGGFPAEARAFPASHAQARLWFLHQLQVDLTSYHMVGLWRLRGVLDRPALVRALAALVERHPSLRTSFHLQQGEVLQIIHPPAAVPLPLEELGDREVEAVIGAWFAEESATPFDLRSGLLLRGRLLAVDEREHRLLLNLHHIASDGWSRVVLARDLGELYNAACSARTPRLPPLRAQVQDYALWQHQRLQGARLQELKQYWRHQLRDLAPLSLPGDRPRRGGETLGGDVCRFRVAPDRLAAFEAVCHTEGTNLQTGLLAWVALLLHRLCRQDDLAIGVPIWGRPHPDLEDLIGFFLNVLPIRSRLRPAVSFRGFLGQVRQTTLAAYDHMDLSFEQMVEGVGAAREVGRTPLVSVLLQLFELPPPSLEGMAGLEADTLACPAPLAKFDLEFFVRRAPDGGLIGELIHATDRFGSEAMARLTRQLLTLLDAVLASPDSPVERLNLLPEEERRQIGSWQEGPDLVLPERWLPARVEQQALRTPEAPALISGDRALSYAELHSRADRWAAGLRAMGVGPESIVAVCLERSEALVVAQLAILRAGAAFLPLDPTAPQARLAQLLALADDPWVLCDEALSGPRLAEARRLDVGLLALSTPTDRSPGAARLAPESAAYLLFTSGTTGSPKGVLVEHRALALRCEGLGRTLRLGPGVRILAQTTPIFDIAILELLIPLAHGATVVIATDAQRRDPRQITALIEAKAIDVLQATPSLLDAWAAAAALPRRPLTVLAGGEPFPPPLALRLCQPGLRVLNGYGPTEAAIYTTIGEVGAERAITIGRPIAGTRVRVLDASGQPCPIGVVGELHIGGKGLARGYRNDAERTAAVFVADPQAEEAGERLYRSGDLVSWNADGTLSFHGREDGQIKLRGVRIEPGEIEARLAEHAAVSQVAVVLRREEGEAAVLVAYWVPARVGGEGADAVGEAGAEELRAYLAERLPSVMVPSAFVALVELPLTANGKLDRRALPAPAFPCGAADRRPPATAQERQLQELWREVLGHAQFGVEDDFFRVGGHSLAAVRLLTRVEQTFGRAVPLAAVFERPTIAALAGLLAESFDEPGPSRAAVIPRALPRRVDREGRPVYPASFAQERLWFLHQLNPGLTAYHLPQLWRLRGELDQAALQATLTDLLERHAPLRTSFRLEGGDLLQVVHPAAIFPLVALEPLEGPQAAAELEAALEAEVRTPFNLGSGRLLRARLWRLAGDEHILLLNLHHIAADGWSLALLARELVAGLNARRAGAPARLPGLRVAYADHAAWQRRQLSADRRKELADSWACQLADLPPLQLPGDHAPPATPSFRGDSLPFTIAAAVLEPFEALCRREGATLQMGLVALVALWLHRLCRQDDLAIGVPIWGRDHPDLEDLIGFFVNTLPIRVRLAPGQGFRALLRQVRRTSIEAYAHQDLPFEQIVEAVQPDRDAARNPLVSVGVQLLELPKPDLEGLDGLVAERLPLRERTARLDLEFFLRRDVNGGLIGDVIHATDRFRLESIARLRRQLLTLLDGVLASPEAPIERLRLLPEEEERQIALWQEGPAVTLPAQTVAERFAQQVRRTPEAPAVRFGSERLCYRELAQRAERLAGELRALGVGPGVLVALCLERSVDLIVTLLAILQAGGAYLPLDPEWPRQRRERLWREAGCRVLCGSEGPVVLPACEPPPGPGAAAGSATAPAPLAYVTITSGSTGTPKGVEVESAAILRLVDPVNGFHLGPGARVLQLAPVAFDAATFEIWGPLLNGGTLVIAPPGPVSLAELAVLLREQRISTLWLTAGLFDAMVEAEPAALAGVRQVLAGGDVLAPASVRRLLAAFPPGHGLINGYGPTENTTFTCCHRLAAGETLPEGTVPIGRPIAGTRVRVLDASGQPCPIGVVGELHIGGKGLARGYRNDAERTAAVFVADPQAEEAGERLYRSGDLVSWNADGTLSFHGREDGQIKLRGVRIEPGEIEARLAEHAAVSQVAVVLRREEGEAAVLVAYWVPARGEEQGAEESAAAGLAGELRTFLRERLPEVMVPSAFVALVELPLTANGKLDRRALPAPWSVGGRRAPTPLDGELERRLRDLWEQVLGHADFGVHDNFFQVGGHSLAAARLAAAVEAALGRPMPVAEVFRLPTLREQAGWLGGAWPGPAAPHLVVLQPRGERSPLHVVHGVGGGLGNYIDLARALHPHRPVFGLQAGAATPDGTTPLPVTVLAARYAEQILARHPGGPIHLLGYSAAGWYAFAVAAALLERGAPVGLLAVLDTHATARIHRRLGVVLLGEEVLPRLGPRLWDLALPPEGERRRRLLRRRLGSFNRALYGSVRLRLPGPERLAAALAGQPLPYPAEDPYVELLRQGYRPPRLPLAVDLFAPPAHLPRLERLWRFYARAGVRAQPLFRDHYDFFRPELMPELAQALEEALVPLERNA